MLSRVKYFAHETLVSLSRNIFMSVAGVLTICVCLTAIGGAFLIYDFNHHGKERFKGGVKFEIFMNVDATQQQIQGVEKELKNSPDIKSFTFLTKQDAYKEFQRLFRDQPDLVNSVDPNALPTSFRVSPKKAEQTEVLAKQYQTLPGVDQVAQPGAALKRELNRTNKQSLVYLVMGLTLLLVTIIVVVNTVRLATFARRREIEVMRLVGASNLFIQVPFLAEGALQGVVGGIIAFFMVYVVFYGFDVVKSVLFEGLQNQGFYATTGDALVISFGLLIGGTLIGLLSSFLGLHRYLDT